MLFRCSAGIHGILRRNARIRRRWRRAKLREGVLAPRHEIFTELSWSAGAVVPITWV
jgi:hypothetical protein